MRFSEKKLDIKLRPTSADLKTVEIKTNSTGSAHNGELNRINVPIAQIQALPRFFGEPDLLKALQTLPGVQQGSEATSAILVRGGSPDQNLILLDGAPLYNPSHLFGIFSSFNTYAIKNVDLYKGAFPARFGGRLSSVIDVSMNDGNMQRLTGQASVGLLAAQFTLSGPIVKQRTSFLLSARRTYHDLYLAPIVKSQTPSIKRLIFNFYDLNFKVRHKISDADQLYLSGYSGQDNFGTMMTVADNQSNGSTKSDYRLGWRNITGTMRWNHIFTPKVFSNFTLTTSRYAFKTSDESNTSNRGLSSSDVKKLNSGVVDYSAKLDLSYQPNPTHHLRSGMMITDHKFVPGASYEKSTSNDQTNILRDFSNFNIRSKELGLFAEDEWVASDKFKVNLGLHFSGFASQDRSYYSLQPRLNFRYELPRNWSVNASYSSMAQYMHLLASNSISLPTDLWVPATAKIKPQQSNQFSLGFTRKFEELALDFSIEGYYKRMNNVLEYRDPSDLQSNMTDLQWEEKVTSGKGRSYGAELFLHKKEGRVNGWAGYTLAWADRQFNEINNGRAFPYKYDRRHTFNLVGIFKVTQNFELSANFIFQSASPFTLATTQYERISLEGDGTLVNENIESRNNIRLQAVHRLDISASLIKVRKGGTVRTWNFSLYNAYNRKNLFYFETNGRTTDKLNLTGYSILPILPSISYSLKF